MSDSPNYQTYVDGNGIRRVWRTPVFDDRQKLIAAHKELMDSYAAEASGMTPQQKESYRIADAYAIRQIRGAPYGSYLYGSTSDHTGIASARDYAWGKDPKSDYKELFKAYFRKNMSESDNRRTSALKAQIQAYEAMEDGLSSYGTLEPLDGMPYTKAHDVLVWQWNQDRRMDSSKKSGKASTIDPRDRGLRELDRLGDDVAMADGSAEPSEDMIKLRKAAEAVPPGFRALVDSSVAKAEARRKRDESVESTAARIEDFNSKYLSGVSLASKALNYGESAVNGTLNFLSRLFKGQDRYTDRSPMYDPAASVERMDQPAVLRNESTVPHYGEIDLVYNKSAVWDKETDGDLPDDERFDPATVGDGRSRYLYVTGPYADSRPEDPDEAERADSLKWGQYLDGIRITAATDAYNRKVSGYHSYIANTFTDKEREEFHRRASSMYGAGVTAIEGNVDDADPVALAALTDEVRSVRLSSAGRDAVIGPVSAIYPLKYYAKLPDGSRVLDISATEANIALNSYVRAARSMHEENPLDPRWAVVLNSLKDQDVRTSILAEYSTDRTSANMLKMDHIQRRAGLRHDYTEAPVDHPDAVVEFIRAQDAALRYTPAQRQDFTGSLDLLRTVPRSVIGTARMVGSAARGLVPRWDDSRLHRFLDTSISVLDHANGRFAYGGNNEAGLALSDITEQIAGLYGGGAILKKAFLPVMAMSGADSERDNVYARYMPMVDSGDISQASASAKSYGLGMLDAAKTYATWEFAVPGLRRLKPLRSTKVQGWGGMLDEAAKANVAMAAAAPTTDAGYSWLKGKAMGEDNSYWDTWREGALGSLEFGSAMEASKMLPAMMKMASRR